MNQEQMIAAYRGDWIARKAIDIPPFDATRQWRNWQANDDQIEALEEAERKLRVQQKLQQALTKARLFGGSCIIMGVDQGTMDQPLDVEKVGKGALQYLHVVTRWGINPAGVRITDLASPWFNEPEYYERKNSMPGDPTNIQNIRIHPSRVIRLNGLDQPDEDRAMEIWGDSVLQLIDDAIKQCTNVAGSVAAMVAEAKVDVIKIPKLTEILSTSQGTNALLARFSNSNVSKSVINSVLIDAEEELTRLQTQWNGIPEVLQMYLLLVCGAVDIPATRFLGQSPVGMNATGESDTRNYYDRLKSDQSTRTTPTIEPLDEILIRHVFGSRDESIYYEWAPLWQMTDAEKATIAKQKADTAKIDADIGLVPESALAKGRQNQLIEDGFYPGLEKAIEEADAAGEFSPHDPEQQVAASEEEQALEQEQQQQQLELAHKALAVKAKPPGGPAKVMPFKAKKKDAIDYNPNHEPGGSPEGGRFAAGGGGGTAGEHPGEGYSASARIRGGVIYTTSVYDAQRALFENRKVELDQPKKISTLIKQLGKTANEMAKQGKAAPSFNLCNVSIAGTNLFCADTKGIPRIKMPQMDEVKTKLFRNYLKEQGYTVEKGKERSINLRASQNELVGTKVAAKVAKMEAKGEDRIKNRLIISNDNYIVDGHHKWATQLAFDARDNKLNNDHKMRVARVNIGIIKLLELANKFTGGQGAKAG